MTRVVRAHSYALDLNDAQRSALESMADGRRAAYNFGLALDRDLYAADLGPADCDFREPADLDPAWRRSLTHYELNGAWPPAWRALTPWNQAAGTSAQIAFGDYTKARDAAIERQRGFPRFRSRDDPHQGFSVRGVKIVGDAITVTNVGALRVKGSTRRLRWFLEQRAGTIQLAHLVRPGVHAAWKCVVIVELDQPEAGTHPGPAVGLDLGIKRFATLSDGTIIENPRILETALARLRMAQKSVSRSEQTRQARETELRAVGSLGARVRLPKSGRHLAKEVVVTRIHTRVVALRAEFHHNLVNDLLARYSSIGIETLNIAGLARNKRLARRISDVGWASFLHILHYKAAAAGVLIVKAGRWFASSQRCSDCGAINRALKDLAIRRWTCPACGVSHDRDVNAARNLIPSPAALVGARTARLVECEKQTKRRQGQKDRAQKAATTRLATAETSRLAKHEAPLARHASRSMEPVAVTRTETLNARRGPVRPKGTTTVAPAVARTATLTAGQEEARTEPSGLPIIPIDSSISLGALGPPALPCELRAQAVHPSIVPVTALPLR